MFEGHDQTVFQVLAEQRLTDPAALADAKQAMGSGVSLARVVLERGLVGRPALLQAVAAHLGCDYLAALPPTLPEDAAGMLPPATARAYGAVPLGSDGAALMVAAVDPFNPCLASDLAFALARDIRVVVADPDRVQSLIRQCYGDEDGSLDAILDELKAEARDARDETHLTADDLAEMAGRTPIIRFVNVVLAQAIREGASDVHFEPFANEFRVRCRVDGVLRELAPPPRSLARPVVCRLKVLANLDIAERRLPQDGRIRLTFAGRAVDLRVSTLPTQSGESVVLRVLDQSATRLELGQIGMPDAVRRGIEAAIARPNGMIIVTGPTGSGKTTTLYGCLKRLNTTDAKLLSVEDPVEYEVEGVMQVPVNLAAGLTFSRALRSFLRQDPDVVMIGEVRDAETARIAIQAALTGHLVLTTLHTNDAPSAVTRLMDMGVPPFLLASAIEAVVAQRLLRRLCPACREASAPPASLVERLEAASGQRFWRAPGCEECQRTGYRGRIAIFEFMQLTDGLREEVAAAAPLVQLRHHAIAEGLVTLRAAGLAAALAGETSVEEVLRYT